MKKEQITFKTFLSNTKAVKLADVLIVDPKTKIKVFYLNRWIREMGDIYNELVHSLDKEFPTPEGIVVDQRTGGFVKSTLIDEATGEVKEGQEEVFMDWRNLREPRAEEIMETKIDVFEKPFSLKELSEIKDLKPGSMSALDMLKTVDAPKPKAVPKDKKVV